MTSLIIDQELKEKIGIIRDKFQFNEIKAIDIIKAAFDKLLEINNDIGELADTCIKYIREEEKIQSMIRKKIAKYQCKYLDLDQN